MSNCVTATFVMPEISKLAEERAKATGEPFISWYEALRKGMSLASNAMIDPDAFLMIVNGSCKPSQFLLIIEALNTYAKENPHGTNAFNLVACYVDRSNYSLRDWVEVIEYFYNWLADNCRHASLTMVLSYILGCTEGNDSSTNDSPFVDIVGEVLGTYGFQD